MAAVEEWAPPNSEIGEFVVAMANECLAVYGVSPSRVQEDYGNEQAITEGGYGHRQVFELVQNGADAILRGRDEGIATPGRIELLLTDGALYCANTGAPIEKDGVRAILFSHMSNKRGDEIGHFGLGFKSVLAVSKNPQFFSRTGSFGFDVERARQRILLVVPDAVATPGLRIAAPVEALAEAYADRYLHQLMEWAASVVRLPRDGERAQALLGDLANFPSQFLLFSSHVRQLVIRLDETSAPRLIGTEVDGSGVIALTSGDDISRWRLFKTDHEPSVEARVDGGSIAGRETVPVAWAVPIDPQRSARGEFWAFFPSNYRSALSGIINAAWKTNADRQNLLEGPYNRELIGVVAELVASNLSQLVTQEDPGAVLDLLPARDTNNWADSLLADEVYERLGRVVCMPDSLGAPRLPSGLALIPAQVPTAAIEYWNSLDHRPDGWAHSSAGSRERRPRAVRLGVADGRTISDWLESLAAPGTPEASIVALRLAAAVVGDAEGSMLRQGARSAAIVLTRSGALVAPEADDLYLGGDYVSADGAEQIVHPAVQEDPVALALLASLGVVPLDPAEELTRVFPDHLPVSDAQWDYLWSLVRKVPQDDSYVVSLLRSSRHKLRMRSRAGRFRLATELLLEGPIAHLPGDAEVVLDTAFHATELDLLLRATGIAPGPVAGGATRTEAPFDTYWQDARHTYFQKLAVGARRPRNDRVEILDDRLGSSGPITPLFLGLSAECNERFTRALAAIAANDHSLRVGHSSQPASYPVLPIEPPSQWAVRTAGVFQTSLGLRIGTDCVGPELARWSDILPCAESAPPYLDLPSRFADLAQELFLDACDRALELADRNLLGSFYGAAAVATTLAGRVALPMPGQIACAVSGGFGAFPPTSAFVTTHPETFNLLAADDVPVVFAETEVQYEMLVRRWQLRPATEVARKDVVWIASGEPLDLQDLFPGLPARALAESAGTTFVECLALYEEINTARGSHRTDLGVHVGDSTCYFGAELEPKALLAELDAALGFNLSEQETVATLRHEALIQASELASRVRAASGPSDKIALLAGEDALRRHIPLHVLDAADTGPVPLEPSDLARLGLAVHGTAFLKEVRNEIRGLQVPNRWAGGPSALQFVRDLGFDDDFAGRATAEDPPWVDVTGPVRLGELHDFQKAVATKLREFLENHRTGRGMVSLPTGAGKTRVVAETFVRAYAAGILHGPVLWIADRRELCEQAVQSWTEAWQAFGAEKAKLRISRFWGRTNSGLADVGERPHLVVATYQTMARRLDSRYEWLWNAAAIIVDEAHGSVAPSYTDILTWMGLDQRTTERPLIGLTATPFRGRRHDDEETRRLVSRYGGHRFDMDVFQDDDPYPVLQEMGVLSRVDHHVLDGTTLHLSGAEMESLKQFKVLPSSAEARLGEDSDRNGGILKVVRDLDRSWPTLVFATSVAHAELLAGLLSLHGIEARAISSNTESGARRHAVDSFRSGEVRVLVNYGVLTTGFDAPETRALIVARPVYSPGLYQQMIGRGLRGPLNGGTERCLIVNVADNVAEYGEALAFTHFEHLWGGSSGNR